MNYNKLEDSVPDARHIQSKEISNTGIDPVLVDTTPLVVQTTPQEAQARKKKYIKWGIIGGVLLIIVVLAIVLPLVLIKRGGGDDNGHGPLPPGNMNPYQSIAQGRNHSGSGAWYQGYLIANINSDQLEEQVKRAIPSQFKELMFLQSQDPQPVTKKVGVDWRNMNFFGPNNQLKSNLSYLFDMFSPNIMRLVLTTGNETRFSVPFDMIPEPFGLPSMRMETLGFRFYDEMTQTFGFQVVDVNNPTNVLLNTIGQTLIFSDKYIQMDYILPSQFVYGFGDRIHELRLSEGAFTMWASGQETTAYDDGRGRGGLSGVHPFLLVQTANSNRYIGLYFRNSNAMTPVLRYNDDGLTSTLSFITIGGQIELYILNQGTAYEVIQTFHQMNLLPKLPPFWSLGWQEASPAPLGNVNNQTSVAAAAQAYLTNGFPLDAVYMQPDSWDPIQDFQLDYSKFPFIAELSLALKFNNQRLVAYIDSAVNVQNSEKNTVYTSGKSMDLFIKSFINEGYLVNSKQGKQCVYVDWLNPKSILWWSEQMTYYSLYVPFDGLWTTQNEPFGDVNGEITKPNLQAVPSQVQDLVQALQSQSLSGGEETPYDQSWFSSFWPLNQISTYFLPFIPRLSTVGNYDVSTLSLNATHIYDIQDYDVHSLYAHGMMRATSLSLDVYDSRQFVLTRGSFTSTAMYTSVQAHTRNAHTWDGLYYALASVLRSQMFGMLMSGADVCGSSAEGIMDEELCMRWYQLAAFMPLARRSSQVSVRTEPFNFKNTFYKQQVQRAMHDRMQYLRLLYTCLFESSQFGGPCLEPISFKYPIPQKIQQANRPLPDFTNTFMFAGALKVSPVMNHTSNGQTTYQSYFPKGFWVNMADWSEVISGNDDYVSIPLTRSSVNTHLAPGSLIPFQNNTDMSILTTADALKKPISLVANRDHNGQAQGTLFLDQGQSVGELRNWKYEEYTIQMQANSIQMQTTFNNSGTQQHVFDHIFILNATDLQDASFACYISPTSLVPQPMQVQYLEDKKTLQITPNKQGLRFSEVKNIYYGSGTDLNLCNPHSFDYNIVGGKIPDLTGLKNVTFNLTHMAGTLDDITLHIGFFDTGILNIKWTWANQTSGDKRVPVGVPEYIVDSTPRDQNMISDTLDKYVIIRDQPFQIDIVAKISGPSEKVLSLQGLIFDEYLNWVNVRAYAQPTALASDFRGVFGLGQRATNQLFFQSGVYTLFNKQIDNPTENGQLPGKQVYGMHPFYMFKHSKNSWVGVYHNHAQAQDWWINNDYKTGQIGIQTISTGGLGDIYVMLSSQKPEFIISKYHSLIGRPVLIPQWALGWNQCKWCYKSTGEIRESMQGYVDNGIPLDIQWVDIDYMQDYKDFTIASVDSAGNPGDFAGLPDLAKYLHTKNMRFVPIIDAGIAYRPGGQGYQAFDEGVKQDVFMKINGSIFVGKVWPNEAAFPDFTNPKANTWWSDQLTSFHKTLPFDGLWQDMNEAANFCNGNCHGDEIVDSPIKYKLPYVPAGEDIETGAVSMDVKHFNNMTQLDAHSFFGTMQVRASSTWFTTVQKQRPLIISRSSFAGLGKYGSTWLGDNHALEKDIEQSIIGIMNMNMFGIPFTGADICGYVGFLQDPEMCTRWHQVGSFYPLSRNHRACWGEPSEPWRFKGLMYNDKQSYMDLMKAMIFRKYSLIRYYYTQITQLSMGISTYSLLYKPLFFEFPEDPNAFNDIPNNVMIGGALKTAVNARNISAETTDYYFPSGTWCSLFEPVGDCLYNEFGKNVTLGSMLNQSYVHLREGFIIPMQNATSLNAKTTVDLQNAPVDLHILGSFKVPGINSWSAEGQYLNDDGLTLNQTDNLNLYRFTASYNQPQKEGGESLYLTVTQIQTAKNYLNTQTNCSAVNQADYLSSIYVYNATQWMKNQELWVAVSYQGDIDNYQTIGVAKFDQVTNRIVYDGTQLGIQVCLSKVFRIAMRNFN